MRHTLSRPVAWVSAMLATAFAVFAMAGPAAAVDVQYWANYIPPSTAHVSASGQIWFNGMFAPNCTGCPVGIYQIYVANGSKTRIINDLGVATVQGSALYTWAYCWNRYASGGATFYANCNMSRN